jgi:hypothetical protein
MCYSPDKATPVEEKAAAVDEEYRRGAFEKVCVSLCISCPIVRARSSRD